MAIPSQVVTLAGKARLATATTENWNSVITAGLFKSFVGALNAPAADKDFVGLVEVLNPLYIVQTLETFSPTSYTIYRRHSYDVSETRTWTDWKDITEAVPPPAKKLFVMQHEGFNEDVPYINGINQVPNFVLHDNGSLFYVELD